MSPNAASTALNDADLPAVFTAADHTAAISQRRFLQALRVRLVGLLIAGVGGAVSWSIGTIQIGGVIALAAFVSAIAAELYSAVARPDRSWYEGRAAAESAKTLAWQFAARGGSFSNITEARAEEKLLEHLNDILHDLRTLQLSLPDVHDRQITQQMRNLRASDFDARRHNYIEDRLRNQQLWYTAKSRWNETRGHRWFVVSVVLEVAGVIAGAARAFGQLDIDLLGILAAIAASIVAWTQGKQYQSLGTAYCVTALELASVVSEAETVTSEEAWGVFVQQAEEAISREHTLWRASRGLHIQH